MQNPSPILHYNRDYSHVNIKNMFKMQLCFDKI